VNDDVAAALRDAIAGDARAVERLQCSHDVLVAEADALSPLVLTSGSLVRVLSDLRLRRISASEAQAWSSLMKRGYVRVVDGPVRAIDIRWDPEDAIVEPLGRLDELGDVIDGTMPDEELDDWISRLAD
jgi:hypothetical protein